MMSAKRGEKMLDDRKKKVLKAIVEEYINTAEPVGSVALTQNEDLKYSSATIRNEMADLEKAGYLEKTHTSSGRIPSEKGYRYYVDELLKDDNISLEEIKYISDKLETKVNEIEDLTKIATTTISEITHYTTLAIGPSTQDLLIEEIKFVLLGPRMLMAIILTNTGMVKETIIKFDEDITDKQVETINYMFNKKLKGQPLEIIDAPLEEYLINEMKYSVKVIKPIIEQIKKVISKDRQIYLEGANKSFDLPEFNSLAVAKNFVNIIDEKELMTDILNSGFAKDINVYIGDENEKEELKEESGLSGAEFCHKGGFLMTTSTLEDAIKACKISQQQFHEQVVIVNLGTDEAADALLFKLPQFSGARIVHMELPDLPPMEWDGIYGESTLEKQEWKAQIKDQVKKILKSKPEAVYVQGDLFAVYPLIHALRKRHMPVLVMTEMEGEQKIVRIPSGS